MNQRWVPVPGISGRLLGGLVLAWFLAGLPLLWILPADAAMVEPERVDLSVAIEPDDRREFFDGEFISFYLSLEREGYIYFFYRDTEENLLQLLPNAENSNHWYPRGSRMPFPALEEPINYVIVPPFGEELLLVFVSDNPEIELPGERLDSGLMKLEIDIERVEDIIYEASKTLFGRVELSFESRSAAQ